VDVPDIECRLADITDPARVTYTVQRITSSTQYGRETIFLLERKRSEHSLESDPT